jgi:hypothetical protein
VSTRTGEIKTRLAQAKYAAGCKAGRGKFGITEQAMLEEFQEHAMDDVEFLIEELERVTDEDS